MKADNPERTYLKEEVVNPTGDFRRAEQILGTNRTFNSRKESIKDDGATPVTGKSSNRP